MTILNFFNTKIKLSVLYKISTAARTPINHICTSVCVSRMGTCYQGDTTTESNVIEYSQLSPGKSVVSANKCRRKGEGKREGERERGRWRERREGEEREGGGERERERERERECEREDGACVHGERESCLFSCS